MQKVKIEIFDPPMCCSTGICGPTIDPTLIRVNETVTKLKKDYSEQVTVERHMLGKSIVALQNNQAVLEMIKSQGNTVLPITTIDGKIVKIKAYATLPELLEFLKKEE